MKIDKSEIIAGFPALTIRKLLRSDDALLLENIMLDLQIDEHQAKQLLGELQELGYVEKFSDERGFYELTILANAFRQAKAIPPISREKADQLFRDFMERVEYINSNTNYLFRVSKIFLFGSYLNKEIPFVNDLDIAVEYEHKIEDSQARDKANKKKREEAKIWKNGKEEKKRFKNKVEYYGYPKNEVIAYLKNKSKYLSLHPVSDLEIGTVVYQQIYP